MAAGTQSDTYKIILIAYLAVYKEVSTSMLTNAGGWIMRQFTGGATPNVHTQTQALKFRKRGYSNPRYGAHLKITFRALSRTTPPAVCLNVS